MTERDQNQIHKLSGIPERLRVFKKGIPLHVQQAYLDYANNIESSEFAGLDTLTKGQNLFSPAVSVEEKKKYLISLAHQGTVEACLTITRFLDASKDNELEDWGMLALEECWLLVERDMFDQPVATVMTGLGGEEDRLRYFVAVRISENSLDFSDTGRRVIEQSFSLVCRQLEAVLEELQVYPDYVTLQLLIPLDVAVAEIIESGIVESNSAGELLDKAYFVTNTEIPAPEEILHHLQGGASGEY